MYITSVIYRYYIDNTNGRIFMDIKYETSGSRLVKTGGVKSGYEESGWIKLWKEVVTECLSRKNSTMWDAFPIRYSVSRNRATPSCWFDPITRSASCLISSTALAVAYFRSAIWKSGRSFRLSPNATSLSYA